MLNKKLVNLSESKLTKALNKIAAGIELQKAGFLKANNKSSLFKTKSFRLREADFISLSNIISHVNKKEDRMSYSDSQVIRGMINYISDNIDSNEKKLISYIKTSS